mgnify:CR=1 FL=1
MFINFFLSKKKLFFSLATKLLGIIINVIFFITVARLLSIADFGNFQFLMSASFFLIIFSTLGLDHKLFIEVSKNLKRKVNYVSSDIVTCIVLINVILFFLLSFLLVFLNVNYKSLFDINLSTLNYFILAIPFIVSNSILYNVLNGYGKNKIYIFFSGPFQNLILIFLVTLNFSFLSLQNVIIFYLISVFCNFVILMYFSKTIFLQPKIKIIRFLRLIKESFFLYKYYILMSLIAAFDVFLVKTIASSYELGLYVFASRFALLISIFFSTSSMFYMPKFIKEFNDGNYEELKKIYHSSTLFIISILFLPFCFLYIYADDIVLIFDEKYISSVKYLQVLLVAHFVGLIFGPNGLLLFYTQNNNKLFIYTFLSFLIYVIFGYFLFLELGVYGVSISFLIYVIIWKLIVSSYFMQVFKFYPSPLFSLIFRNNDG